jgi:hypothetical protein
MWTEVFADNAHMPDLLTQCTRHISNPLAHTAANN